MRSTEDTSLRNSWAGAPWYLLLGYVNDVIALADALNLDTFAVLGVSAAGRLLWHAQRRSPNA